MGKKMPTMERFFVKPIDKPVNVVYCKSNLEQQMATTAKTTPVRKATTFRNPEEAHIGSETTDWAALSPEEYPQEIKETLRHYGYFGDRKSYMLWATTWMKKNRPADLEYFKAAEDWRTSSTMASLMKMELNGCDMSVNGKAFISKSVEEVFQAGRANKMTTSFIIEDDTTPKAVRKTPVELLKEKTSELLGEIEGHVDEYTTGELAKDFSL